MTVKLKTEITVPKSVRRKAGFKSGDRIAFKVSNGTITIVPGLSPDEREDALEMREREGLRHDPEELRGFPSW